MDMGSFLRFMVNHNEAIIQWLVFAIVVTVAFILFRSLFFKQEEAEAEGAGLGLGASAQDLEITLQKILAKSSRQDQPASVEGGNPQKSEASPSPSELAELRLELSKRQQEIEDLKLQLNEAVAASTQAGSAPPTQTSDDSALRATIEELEARLAEYGILEDDIADLSLYKEENQKLKAELERLRQGGGVSEVSSEGADLDRGEAAEMAAEMAAETASEAAAFSQEIMDGVPQEGGQSEVEPAPPTPRKEEKVSSAAAAAAASAAAFNESPEASAAAEPTPSSEPTTAAAAPNPAVAQEDDLLAEFAVAMGVAEATDDSAPPAQEQESDAEASLEEFDTSKMLAEMEALSQVALNSDQDDGESIFEESLDTDKMEEEASRLAAKE